MHCETSADRHCFCIPSLAGNLEEQSSSIAPSSTSSIASRGILKKRSALRSSRISQVAFRPRSSRISLVHFSEKKTIISIRSYKHCNLWHQTAEGRAAGKFVTPNTATQAREMSASSTDWQWSGWQSGDWDTRTQNAWHMSGWQSQCHDSTWESDPWRHDSTWERNSWWW